MRIYSVAKFSGEKMDAYERLVHYAEVSAESELSRAPLSVYKLSNATIHRRNKAVNWINVVSL